MTGQGIVVVDRQRRDLHAYLRRELVGRALVILDRRGGSRSAGDSGERRRDLTVADAVLWQDHGCLVVSPVGSLSPDLASLRAEVRQLARRLVLQATN